MKRAFQIYLLEIFLIIFVLLVSSCENLILDPEVKAPPPQQYESRFTTLLDSLRYTLDFPALAGAIVTDTGIIEIDAVGCRRYGGPKNITVNDLFHIGSCGKAFTSVLMGTLVDEGLASWNTTLPEIFPEYASIMRDEYKNVTVRNILSHSAGFMRSVDNNILKETDPVKRKIEAMVWAIQQAPVQQRGKYLYSNLGYLIAGAITEKLTNRNYEDLLLERVTRPLGITTAAFGTMGTQGMEDQPLQHTPDHAPIVATPNAGLDPCYNPAGGLYMSIGDWGKYIQWVLKVENGIHQTLLNDETALMLTSPSVSTGGVGFYAFGWGGATYEAWAAGKTLNHSGSNGYNYSTAYIAPKKHFGIIVMTNQGAVGEDWLLGPAVIRLKDFHLTGH